ncbi:MAG: S8 family serine peptidase [Desulfuromonadales bacterium]|nr:S8 family serine peptidase [Desulfuromonadales bacterium]
MSARRRIFVFIFFFLCLLWLFPVSAAPFSPSVPSVLEGADDEQSIPVIVKLRTVESPPVLARLYGRARRQQFIWAMRSRTAQGSEEIRHLLQGYGIVPRQLWLVDAIAFSATPAMITQIAQMAEVEAVTTDDLIQMPTVFVDGVATPEWNIARTGAPQLWAEGIDGAGVTIAILDSGINIAHPDLAPRWRDLPGDWFDPYGNSTTPYDFGNYHGTAVASVAVGGSAGGTATGMAPGSSIIAAKIFRDDGTANNSYIIEALQWSLNPGGNADSAPHIINNSWGYADNPDQCQEGLGFGSNLLLLRSAIQTLRNAGIAVVAAAGNTGPSASTSVSPANFAESFSVGATAPNNAIAHFSARGPSACLDDITFPDLVAPGVAIRVAGGSAGYRELSGTSFAAPHIAGAMALLLQAAGPMPVDELEDLLALSATDLGDAGVDDVYGYGLVNVSAALGLIADAPAISLTGTVATADPSVETLDFGAHLTGSEPVTRMVTVRNAGGGTLSVTGVNTPTAPFSITADSCNNASLVEGEGCSFNIVFLPGTSGSYSSAVNITSNDPLRPLITLEISAALVESLEPRLSIHPAQIHYGHVPPESAAVEILSLTNDGEVTISGITPMLSDLSAPFSLKTDNCGSSLGGGATCHLTFSFSPVAVGAYEGSVLIASSDPHSDDVPVLFSGIGNTPPSKPQLVSPADGALSSGNVVLSWTAATDADGDPVTHTLLLADNQQFNNPLTFPVQPVATLLLGGGLLALTLLRRRRLVLSVSVVLLVGWLVSCGGGGGGGGSSSEVSVSISSISVDGLKSGTTYYWKVIAEDDRGATTQSDTRFFSVE